MIYCGIICEGARQFGLAVFSLSVHSYFLWSALIYTASGLALAIGRPDVEKFMCNSQKVMSSSQGCEGCRAELLMCPKNLCWTAAVNITWQTQAKTTQGNLYQAFLEASTDTVCNTLVRKVQTPVQMITELQASASQVTEGCTEFHCGVLSIAVGGSSDLDSPSGVCTDEYGTKPPDEDQSECTCAGLLSSSELLAAKSVIDDVCGNFLQERCPWGESTPRWCNASSGADASASGNSGNGGNGGAAFRRLGHVRPGLPPGLFGGPMASELAPAKLALAAPGAGAEGIAAFNASELPRRGCGSAATAAAASGGLLSWLGGRSRAAEERRLQDAAPAPSDTAAALNDALEDWTVGPWSKCECYQPCIPGVKERLVQCLATKCKDPEPASKEPCVCRHCAQCTVVTRLIVLSILFASQAGLAFLMFLSFLHATTVKEESLIKIGIAKKLMGALCKNLPPVVRLLTLFNDGFIGLILAQTFVPKLVGLEWNSECFDSGLLRLLSLIVFGLCVFQLFLGRCAKRLTRKPPWLFIPDRGNWPPPFRQLRYMFRAIGP